MTTKKKEEVVETAPKRVVPGIMIRVTKEKKYIPIVKKGSERVFEGKEHQDVKGALEEASNYCKEHTCE